MQKKQGNGQRPWKDEVDNKGRAQQNSEVILNMKYKSNNATMGEICAQMLKHEKTNKPISSNKNLMSKINEAESKQQCYYNSVKPKYYPDKSDGSA